jgi:hypothetical protein
VSFYSYIHPLAKALDPLKGCTFQCDSGEIYWNLRTHSNVFYNWVTIKVIAIIEFSTRVRFPDFKTVDISRW